MDFTATAALDDLVRRKLAGEAPAGLATKTVRLAILGSSTLAHLHAGVRVAGLRREIWITSFEAEYGQYRQALLDPGSGLHAFRPDTVLFAFDAHHLAQGVHPRMDGEAAEAALKEAVDGIVSCWGLAQRAFGASVIQQAVLDVFPALMGGNEHLLPGSRSRFVRALNMALRQAAAAHGVDLLALDEAARVDGLRTWHDPALWHRSKQEVSPVMSPSYGELVARLVAARHGRSYKCLVLDLDNTLWGGVIGDDGLEGIVLGQGSALGEGYAAVQAHAKALAERGIILAVCSKNDEANALEPFERHPDMVLRRADIACFRASWDDKAANLRAIAGALNIGLDAMVFLDDNPFERNLVREALPMVAVPEWDDEPALVPRMLADAGYFESVGLTQEDRARTAQYQGNQARQALAADASDLEGYLRGLEMRLVWGRFDEVGLQRIVQLINKTNQFNLTTQRLSEAEVRAVMADPAALGLQMRLIDRFGDNGIVAVVIGRLDGEGGFAISTWLMSCRVLGRQMEQATLVLVVAEAVRMGARRLVGAYSPTQKNAMVRDHYERLGFSVAKVAEDGASLAVLELAGFVPPCLIMRLDPPLRQERDDG